MRKNSSLYSHDKAVILTYLIKYPCIGHDVIDAFYESVASAIERYAANELFKIAEEEYSSADPRTRRMRFKPCFLYTEYFTVFGGESVVSFVFSLALYRDGKLLSLRGFSDVWDTGLGLILDSEAVCSRDTDEEFMVDGREVVFIHRAPAPIGESFRRSSLRSLVGFAGREKLKYEGKPETGK